MAATKLKASILVVSETAFSDPASDRCGSALRDVFRDDGDNQWEVVELKIVPDSLADIQSTVVAWSSGAEAVNLIVTTGGTGFAVKDNTPEAITPLLQKSASGLVHGMLAASLSVTPFALMSRPVAGVRNGTLIITVPGSPKGAKENVQSILKLLPHACQQAAGADSRSLHAGGVEKLEADAGLRSEGQAKSPPRAENNHQHHHHHRHHPKGHSHGGHAAPVPHTDPSQRPLSNDHSLGPTERHRSSPYPMLSVESALEAIVAHTPPCRSVKVPLKPFVVGQVLASDIAAVESVPAFRASIVDGYAVHIPEGASSNEKGVFPVAFASHAHPGNVPTIKPGQIARITTGAPLPPGSSAVVMVEDTVIKSRTSDGKEEAEVEILTAEVKPGENVREIGSDVKAGDMVMKKGEGVSAIGGEFGLLASVGVSEVDVYEKPVVGVLSTGDEIVPHERPGELRLGEVRDTNRPTLLTAVKAQGFEAVDLGIASDKPESLESSIRQALAQVDVLITTGGVSMGEFDLLKPTIERSLGGNVHFGRVSMKPGKPTTFATVPGDNVKSPKTGERANKWSHKVIFSLPGNPASAVVTFMLFVLPSLHQMSGISPTGLSRVSVRLASTVNCDPAREEYHRVALMARAGEGDGGLWAVSTGGQRSSRIGSFKGANGLVKLPAGGGAIERGSQVEALMMGPLGGLAETL